MLSALDHQLFFIRRCLCALSFPVLAVIYLSEVVEAYPPRASGDHTAIHGHIAAMHEQQHEDGADGWEGSVSGIAYSQFNHRFAGLCILLIGLSELGSVIRCPSPLWARLVLAHAFGVVGVFLLVWSDHKAWPIGSMSFAQTFFGQDPEILQHKFYGVLATTVALSEFLRRIGWVTHPAWAVPLPFLP